MGTAAELPRPVHHSHTLSDGRNFSYYTFEAIDGAADPPASEKDSPHPILYFHGFPGSGLEGAICAAAAEKAGGRIFAPDRPGFGHSDGRPADRQDEDSARLPPEDAYVEGFVGDVWDFVRGAQWTSFSVIGVSGGAPYTLAFLSSYLAFFDGSNPDAPPPPARMESISIVGGALCSAGADGMMPANRKLYGLGMKPGFLAWAQLRFLFAVPSVLTKVLPDWIVLKGFDTKDLPKVDRDVFGREEVTTTMMGELRQSLRQGSWAAAFEAKVIFREKQGFEDALKCRCSSESAAAAHLPRISLFHGHLDANMPLSHAKYVHKELLAERSNLVEFSDLGHISLVVERAAEYVANVMPESRTSTSVES